MRVACLFGFLIASSTADASTRVEAYWQSTLIPDAIATTLLGVAIASISGDEVAPFGPPAAIAGAFTYALGAPIVHASRNNNGPAFASLGLRVALPVAGGWLAGRTTDDPDERNRRIRLSILAGMVTAVVIDHVLLARQTIEVAPPRWSPTAVPTQGGVSLGLSATF